MSSVSENSEYASDSLSESNDNFSGYFEGPEKTMEIEFHLNKPVDMGLRSLKRDQIDRLCTLAKCSILTCTSNDFLDAYVLSESSLFVYKNKLIMKTCGTTTLLCCVNALLEYADNLGMKLACVTYSRKNLAVPTAQHYPHATFGDEVTYIKEQTKINSFLRGAGHVLGPLTGDHWFVYVADKPLHPIKSICNEITPSINGCTLNLMMFGIAKEVREIFCQERFKTGREMTVASGISTLCPGAIIDETAFTPCGYSMNAIQENFYFTTHVTPEEDCSYISFETNFPVLAYTPYIQKILRVFKPSRFLMTLIGPMKYLTGLEGNPLDAEVVTGEEQGDYIRESKTCHRTEKGTLCEMANFSIQSYDKMDLDEMAYAFPVEADMCVSADTDQPICSATATTAQNRCEEVEAISTAAFVAALPSFLHHTTFDNEAYSSFNRTRLLRSFSIG
jgi:S-adenosylmethionine decarboxylase